jgi:O-antigen/teichoic acid export membrane protein
MNIYKSFSVYLGATFIERGLSFLILPVFTFYLAPGDFGMLSLLSSLFVFTLPVISLGTQSAISVAYFKESKSDYPIYVTSTLFVPVVISVSLMILLFIFGSTIATTISVPKIWLLAIPVFALLSMLNSTLLIDYQIKQEAFHYGIFSLSNSAFNLLLSVALVILFGMNFEGRLIGQYFSILTFSLIAIFLLYRRGVITLKVSKEFIKDSLQFGLPIVPHVIGCMVINMSDKVFINQILGKADLGIYNMGYALGSSISILCNAFAIAIVPYSYEKFTKGDLSSKKSVVKVYWKYVIFILIVVLILSITAPIIFKLLIDKRYSNGSIFVKWISLGFFFQGCYLVFANIIYYTKKTKILFYWSFFNITINLILNYFLIKKYGVIGAAYSQCISYFVFFVAIALFSYKYYPLPWFYFLKREKGIMNY